MSPSTEKGPATEWRGLVRDVAAAANDLFAVLGKVVDYKGLDFVPDEMVVLSDHLADLGLGEMARKIAPPPNCIRDFDRFDAALEAYPEEALSGATPASPEVVGELRAAADAVMKSQPRCRLELGRKAKIAAVVGLYKKIRTNCSRPDPYLVSLYNHFWHQLAAIEPWFLAGHVGYRGPFGELKYGARPGNFIVEPGFIDELLECAGPGWLAAIAADVTAMTAAWAGRDGEGNSW